MLLTNCVYKKFAMLLSYHRGVKLVAGLFGTPSTAPQKGFVKITDRVFGFAVSVDSSAHTVAHYPHLNCSDFAPEEFRGLFLRHPFHLLNSRMSTPNFAHMSFA